MNSLDESILSGIKNGIRNEVPSLTNAIQRANILKAIELDNEFQLGIFSQEEKTTIIKSEKDLFLNHNPDIKRMIKRTTRK